MSQQTPKIRVVFMGTPVFAQPILRSMIEQSYNIVAVYTRPDKPQGRDQEVLKTPIKELAEANNLVIEQPEKFDEAAIATLRAHKPDLIVVVAYGKILPKEVLEIPGFGCINVHPSLLPKYRGPSPIQNTLINGETITGTTIMLLDSGMDSGDILAQQEIAIERNEMHEELAAKLSQASADLLLETLPKWINREIKPVPQDHSKVTLCQLIEREDGHILWTENADTIYNAYRALSPWPGVYSFWQRSEEHVVRIKFLEITLLKSNPETKHRLGEVFEAGDKLAVQAEQGAILIEKLQLEGKNLMTAEEFYRGYPQFVGTVLK